MTSFVEYWPQWPVDTQGHVLVNEELQVNLTELIAILWSPNSAFLAEANAQRNFTDFHCTDWVTSETELPDLPGGFDWTYERIGTPKTIENIHEKLRKVRFENKKGSVVTSSGFKTEEVQRCICHEEKRIVVDACVTSTAPLCENIRVLCRYKAVAKTDWTSQLTVSYHIVYLQSLHFVLKGALEKGVRDGLAANYETYTRVLRRHIPSRLIDPSTSVLSTAESKDSANWPPLAQELEKPYCSVINWSTLPPGELLNAVLDVHSANSVSHGMLHFVWQLCLFVSYGVFLYGLYLLWTAFQQKWMTVLHVLTVDPPPSFAETMRVVLLFLALLEITHFCLFFVKRFFSSPRLSCVYLYETIRANLLRFHTVKCHSVNGIQETHLSAEQSELKRSNSAVNKDNTEDEEIEDKSDTWTKKLSNAFWILFQYNSPDFPRFDQAPPIEQRTKSDGSIVEEIFENERLQPFRGWGHTWPGHFLPTDRFSHWSSFDSNGNIVTSDRLEYIQPELPDGWEWIEKDWKLDTSKADTNAVDGQGWYYSLDFPWIRFTPEKNSGIRKLSDFVRRRRFVRTRRRIQESDPSQSSPATKEEEAGATTVTSYFSFFNFL